MREISLDTETTGLDPDRGDRIVEIGCVEMINQIATDNVFHVYIDPERNMSVEASDITGITDDFLKGKPKFREVAQGFIDFIADSPLVIHNAAFDMKFINSEFARVGAAPLPPNRAIDTLAIAKRRFPGAQANLDALCRRFGVDNSAREKHGALLDAELLAEVYLELTGGRQPGFTLSAASKSKKGAGSSETASAGPARQRGDARPVLLDKKEKAAHAAFVETLGDEALWLSSRRAQK